MIVLAAVMICSVSAGLLAPAPYAYPGYGHVAAPLAPVAIARPALAVARPAYAAAAVDEYDPNPQYSYAYDIQDALTGKTTIYTIIEKLKSVFERASQQQLVLGEKLLLCCAKAPRIPRKILNLLGQYAEKADLAKFPKISETDAVITQYYHTFKLIRLEN